MHDYAKISVTNNSNISLVNISSACLKSLSRIIASESKHALCTHILMAIASQFCVRKWTNKSNNLSSGDIVSMNLTKNMLQSNDAHPIDSRHMSCFHEHGCSCVSGNDASRTC